MSYLIYTENYNDIIPEGVLEIKFSFSFDENIDEIVFPNSVKSISFGIAFNQNIDKVVFPDSLKSIEFAIFFNQNIDKVVFPDSLESITFCPYFNQNIDKVIFPKSLKSITFMNYINNQMNMELKLNELKIRLLEEPITNLPININKIIFLKIDNENNKIREENLARSKIPFGCEIVYE